MAVNVQVSKEIDQPVSKVFDFFARDHVRNHPRWDPDIQLEKITDGPIGVGTIIRRRNSRSGVPVEGTMEIVEFEPDRAFGSIIRDGETEMRGLVTFTAEAPERTRLTFNLEIADMDKSIVDVVEGQLARSLKNINMLMEGDREA